MKVAVVGATGLVGSKMLQVLEERHFPVTELLPVASSRSWGKKVTFQGREWTVIGADEAIAKRPTVAIFSAGGSASGELAPKFAAVGCRVVDNSSYWRMDPTKKLVIPEINGDVLGPDDYIIANPNCSTIQMLMALAPLHKAYGIKRIVYPHPIDLNTLPHIDVFLDNGYTKEEMKMVNETHKILRDDSIAVTATTVRVPVWGGHSESVNVEFRKPFDLDEARALMAAMPGVVIQDDPENKVYPMPRFAEGKDEVFVGRIRRDFSVENGLNLWCVADNLRKGAATNAVQIAQLLLEKGLLAE